MLVSAAPTHFHLLSFEGPDAYARAGGIATRVSGLIDALVGAGHPTDLWFVGDPAAPGFEQRGLLALHRWCQWISAHHPGGVYDGEEGKVADYAASLPPYLMRERLMPLLAQHGRAVVVAEEWQTVGAVLHLDALLREAGLRDRVTVFWNANNTFGFERIDWRALASAATITTVSRYMKQRMEPFGVQALVIPNGLGPESFKLPNPDAVRELRRALADRLLLAKVARWDPDKRWLLAIDTIAALKRAGARPLLVARGGLEAHEGDVLERAREHRLSIVERTQAPGGGGLIEATRASADADMIVLRSHIDPEARSVLFRSADAVLANSAHEPFGLVGLEAMAVGGLACTGASGEDYAIDGENALVLQRNDPNEFVALYGRVKREPRRSSALRRSGMTTAKQYAWPRVIERSLLPRI